MPINKTIFGTAPMKAFGVQYQRGAGSQILAAATPACWQIMLFQTIEEEDRAGWNKSAGSYCDSFHCALANGGGRVGLLWARLLLTFGLQRTWAGDTRIINRAVSRSRIVQSRLTETQKTFSQRQCSPDSGIKGDVETEKKQP